MFVRWQVRGAALRAFLIRSTRVDGQPAAQHVGYLGSFRPGLLNHRQPELLTLRVRSDFWRHCRGRLNELERAGQITRADRIQAERGLARRIREPTPEEDAVVALETLVAIAELRAAAALLFR
jgi:hypothetical protein